MDSEVFVPDVRRVYQAAEKPRRQSPQTKVGRGRGKHSADDEVGGADNERRANPWLTR